MNEESVKFTVSFVTFISIGNVVFVPFLEGSTWHVRHLKECFKTKKVVSNTSSIP